MDKLVRQDYVGDTVEIARRLVGCLLVRQYEGETLVFRITETEAYVGAVDKACHAYGYKRTPRTKTMFATPGTAYIYLIYGMYHCLNLVTEPEGEPCAVLIRSAQAVENVDRIAQNRFGCKYSQLTAYQRKNFLNGPGKLCKGLFLTREQDGISLLNPDSGLYLLDGPAPEQIQVGTRIGIDYAEEAVDFPWRFWCDNETL